MEHKYAWQIPHHLGSCNVPLSLSLLKLLFLIQFNSLLRMCYAQSLSCVQLFVTPWTVAPPALCHGISLERILECVAISFSKGSFWPRSNPCTLHWQVDSLPLNHLGSLLIIYMFAVIYFSGHNLLLFLCLQL